MPASEPDRETPVLVTAAGSLDCEAALLEEIDCILDQIGDSILARPIWLVVPSHSLRSHILSSVVRHRGRSVAGLGCWTLHGLASELVGRSGEPVISETDILPLLVRRFAPSERPLRDGLEHLTDGYSSVVSTVQDLLNAGLDVAHQDALDDALAEEGPGISGRAAVERARSIVRVATRVLAELDKLDLGHSARVLQQATEIVRFSSGIEPDPAGLLVHGFADATGLATDFILALLERFGGRIFVDLPPDVGDLSRSDPGIQFIRRFSDRIEAIAERMSRDNERPATEPEIGLVRAHGAQAEVRETAIRIRAILDEGIPAEQIGVVSRRLDPYVSPIRTHFSRLGIPFSGVGAKGPQLPMGRDIQAFLDLLNNRQKCSIDRWLDIRFDPDDTIPTFDLRLGLFGLGAGSLEEVANLDLSHYQGTDTYPLPVRQGFDPDDIGESRHNLHRRTIPMTELLRLREEAGKICGLFSGWRDRGGWRSHHEELLGLVDLLGWVSDSGASMELARTMFELSTQIPDDLDLGSDEAVALVTDSLQSVGFCQLGGIGSGVQVLDVIEARGRTFEQLFVLGLNQGVFPRIVREDPLFDDGLRQVIGREGHGVLPDLPRKLAGHNEERYLFAQLLWSSRHVTLSWQFADDDGKALNPSPLLERLRLRKRTTRGSDLAADLARYPFSGASRQPDTDVVREIMTPFEQAVRTALWGSSSDLLPVFELALESSAPTGFLQSPADRIEIDRHGGTSAQLARARLEILAEFDPKPGQTPPPGPYFGYIGSTLDDNDPRIAQRLYITTLEHLAQCPWQTFLERLLRLERYPDPTDVLPGVDALLLGRLVHRVLEIIVGQQLGPRDLSFEELRETPPSSFKWPDTLEIEKIVDRESSRIARENGLNWDGFAEILAAIALPFINNASQWSRIDKQTRIPVAVEVDAELEILGRSIGFRADRIDKSGDALAIVDYKTARNPIFSAKREAYRRKNLIRAVREGRHLQAVAYSLAGTSPSDSGEYLFIRPDFAGPDDYRTVVVRGDDSEAHEAFFKAAETLVDAWSRGLFFPRLVVPGSDTEPRSCSYCEVAEACLRGDSGSRGRLGNWAESGSEESRRFRLTWFMSDQESRPEPDR